MIKIEQAITTKIQKYLKFHHNKFPSNYLWEVKVVRGNTLAPSAVKEHQIRGLKLARNKHFCYKYPDVGYDRSPVDGMFMSNAEGYLIIYYVKSKNFYVIDVEEYIKSPKKMTENKAKSICYHYDKI